MISTRWATWFAIIIMAVAWFSMNLPLFMTGTVLLIKVVSIRTEKYQNEANPY